MSLPSVQKAPVGNAGPSALRPSARVSRLAVAFVLIGGAVWVLAAVLYSIQVASCFSCGAVVVAPGIEIAGFPLQAIHALAWDSLYANLYVATIGLLAIIVGVTGFRRAERWAWYAVAVFVLAGVMTGILDYLSWGGWYTFLIFGLLPLAGLLLSTRGVFAPASRSRGVHSQPDEGDRS